MIRNLLSMLFLLFACTVTLKAQSDTSAYETQRLKINDLLAQRSLKFGQYEKSLDARTGIFGFQTKTDIKNSNEILREITLNDNDIFKELKVLLDYKDLQFQQVKSIININSDRMQSYMVAIKKLQDQNQQLKEDAKKAESGGSLIWYIFTFFALVAIGIVYFFYKKLKYK